VIGSSDAARALVALSVPAGGGSSGCSACSASATTPSVGLPVPWSDGRRCGFGLLPVADAFLARARARRPVPVGPGAPGRRWLLVAPAPAVVLRAVPRARDLLAGRGRPVRPRRGGPVAARGGTPGEASGK
jgi:hypothetical protein